MAFQRATGGMPVHITVYCGLGKQLAHLHAAAVHTPRDPSARAFVIAAIASWYGIYYKVGHSPSNRIIQKKSIDFLKKIKKKSLFQYANEKIFEEMKNVMSRNILKFIL